MKIKLLLLLALLLPLGLYAQDAADKDQDARRQLFGDGNQTEQGQASTKAQKKKKKGKDLTKYLQGAVPVVDGRVVFTADIATQKTQDEALKALRQWASTRFVEQPATLSTEATGAKVVSVDSVRGKMVCEGDEYLVFTRKFLVLNQARIHYVFTAQYEEGTCKVSISKISYDYNPTPEEGTYTRIAAENQITDQYALRSNGTKLVREAGTHFRVFTVDLKDELFAEVKKVLTQE